MPTNLTENDTTGIVICAEKLCYIIELISIQSINDILKSTKAECIDVTSAKSYHNSIEKDTIEDTEYFLRNLQINCRKNKFIELTLFPIISCLIRRNYYPTISSKIPVFSTLIEYLIQIQKLNQN